MTPDTTATPSPAAADPAEQMLDKAESAGQLQPVEEALKTAGRTDDISARDFMKFAQFDDRTKGKTPPELATMITDDDSIIDDVIAEQEKREGGEEPKSKESPQDMMADRMNKARAEQMAKPD